MQADLIIRQDETKEYVLKCSESEARLIMLSLINLNETSRKESKVALFLGRELDNETVISILTAMIQSANIYNKLFKDWAMSGIKGIEEIRIPKKLEDLYKKLEETASKLR